MTHPEFQVGRLVFPDYCVQPRPRRTLGQLERSVMARSEIHPPGYYFLTWMWNGLFGTSLTAIRMPTAIAGILTVIGVWFLALGRDGPATAAVSSLILALHGLHVYESMIARLWAWLVLLAVLSVLLAIKLEEKWKPSTAAAYVLVVAWGVWTDYSFMAFLVPHCFYILLRDASKRHLPRSVQLLIQVFVLSLPVLIYLRWDLAQGYREYLTAEPIPFLLSQARFSMLVDHGVLARLMPTSLIPITLTIIAAVGTILLVLGLRRTRFQFESIAADQDSGNLSRWTLWIAPLITTLVLWHHSHEVQIGWRIPAGLALLAWATVLMWPLWARVWSFLAPLLLRLRRCRPVRYLVSDVIVCHALLPISLIVGVSFITPVMADRVFLMTTPFLLILMVRGLALDSGRQVGAVFLLAAMIPVAIASTVDYRSRPLGRNDFSAVYRALEPRVQPDDLILMREDKHWATPMYYYLPPQDYNLARPKDLPGRLYESDRLIERVWIIAIRPFTGTTAEGALEREILDLTKLTPGYESVETITFPHAAIVLRNVRP